MVDFHRKLLNDTGLARRCLANFQRDGRSGFYDPEWQSQAREAFERHRKGDFDEYLRWKLYQDWPELEELHKSREKAAAEAHAVKMAEMVKEDQEDEEQHAFKTDAEDPASVQTTDGVEKEEQNRVAPSTEEPTDIQATSTVVQEDQHATEVSTTVSALDHATELAKVEEPRNIQTTVEVQAQSEVVTLVEKQEESITQTHIEAAAPAETSQTAVDQQDQEQQTTNIHSLTEVEEAVQVVESNSQNDFQASKESTERLPTTPPREHSPDVQCINDSQETNSSSPHLVIEDLAKPLPSTSDVQLESLPKSTLIS